MSEVSFPHLAADQYEIASHPSRLDQAPVDDYLAPSPTAEHFLHFSGTLPRTTVAKQENVAHISHTSAGRVSSAEPQHALGMPKPVLGPKISPRSHSQTLAPHVARNCRSPLAANPAQLRLHQQPSASISPHGNGQTRSPASANYQLSPPGGYASETGYSELSEHTTPGFDDDFTGADFGQMPALDEEEHTALAGLALNTDHDDLSDTAAVSHDTLISGYPTQLSQGTRTTSSYLLSPVNTNTPSPPMKTQLAGGGYNLTKGPGSWEECNPATLPGEGSITTQTAVAHQLQQTPALTGSSRTSSGESLNNIVQMQSPSQLTSPVVKVENYSRGEPSQNASLGRGLSKRSRTAHSSAHLSPHLDQDESSEENEDVERPVLQPLTNTAVASRDQEGSWIPCETTGQAGLAPDSRSQLNQDVIPNLREQEEHRKVIEKNADVETWLSGSAASSVGGDGSFSHGPGRSASKSRTARRRRAKSTGDVARVDSDPIRSYINGTVMDDSDIPGPGVLIDEESADSESEAETHVSSPPASPRRADVHEEGSTGYFPPFEDEEPHPRRFYGGRPWADPLWQSDADGSQNQPTTANAAMMRFRQRAENIETASRVATWGTRRLSETDLDKMFAPEGFSKRLSFNSIKEKNKDRGDKRGNFFDLEGMKKLIPKRSGSNLKRNRSVKAPQEQHLHHEPTERSRKESVASGAPPRRIPSFSKRPKTPKINTGSAVAAITGQIASIGRSGSVSATGAGPPSSPWAQARDTIKRSRSRSDLTRKPSPVEISGPGLSDLLARSGGPPMPMLASPPHEQSFQAFGSPEAPHDQGDNGEIEDNGVTMNLNIRPDPISPNFTGFYVNVKQLNPRLVPALVDRVSHEQVRRFKKLVEHKVKHLNAMKIGRCNSKEFCFALGGQAKILPSKGNNKDPDTAGGGFQIAASGASDDESGGLAEGTVAAAQFPAGVPLPPVKRLPAEFECPLCFQVKKFQKPSDWTKHVHEDVQPFTCTFPNCAEPKSFKRKADWVRHENERHRQLEWWTCNLPDCSHTCFRKDNFVQHLVREHKKPEPKVKANKAATKSALGSRSNRTRMAEERHAHMLDPEEASQAEIDRVWALVEECRHDTPKLPRDEPCKFCGNVCSSWKKLTVHLARHMEQISLPILGLVEQEFVTADTIIRSDQQRLPRAPSRESPAGHQPTPKLEPHDPLSNGNAQNISQFQQPNNLQYALPVSGPTYPEHTAADVMEGYFPQSTEYTGQAPLQDRTASQSRSLGHNIPSSTSPYQGIHGTPPPSFNSIGTGLGFPGIADQHAYQAYSNMTSAPSISQPPGFQPTDAPMTTDYDQQTMYTAPTNGASYPYPSDVGEVDDSVVNFDYSHVDDHSFDRASDDNPPSYLGGFQDFSYKRQ
ncbi:MAG: hypothetical protein M1837_006528 [Sclerophora amabilis]|nr:MAG: hypothetical protein M1837_006528 [Sclerophora amabilis]